MQTRLLASLPTFHHQSLELDFLLHWDWGWPERSLGEKVLSRLPRVGSLWSRDLCKTFLEGELGLLMFVVPIRGWKVALVHESILWRIVEMSSIITWVLWATESLEHHDCLHCFARWLPFLENLAVKLYNWSIVTWLPSLSISEGAPSTILIVGKNGHTCVMLWHSPLSWSSLALLGTTWTNSYHHLVMNSNILVKWEVLVPLPLCSCCCWLIFGILWLVNSQFLNTYW